MNIDDMLDNILTDQRHGFHSQAGSHEAIKTILQGEKARLVYEAMTYMTPERQKDFLRMVKLKHPELEKEKK